MKIRKAKSVGLKRWMLDIGIVDGKRRRLFYETKEDAEAGMAEHKALVKESGREALTLPIPKRLEYTEADRRCVAMKTTIAAVLDFYQSNHKNIESKLLADACLECVKAKESANRRRVYTEGLRRTLKIFCALHPFAKCSDITRDMIEAWARSGDVKTATVRSRLIDIKTLFSFAKKRRWCLENPAADIEPIKLDLNPPGIHTVKVAHELLKKAVKDDPGLIGYIAPIYFGGLRPIESQTLRKENIHDGLLEVTPENSKTRRRRFIEINETLKSWLAVPGVEFGHKNLKRRLNRLKKGFPWPHDVLRHSFCSYGLPKYGATKIAEWAGHSERILFAHYRERVKPADAEAYWNLRP